MKKKIVIVSLIVCILVLSIASTTMAYFTDTKQVANTFTTGDVKIQITEAPVKVEEVNANGTQNIIKADGDRIINTGIEYENVRNLYPGQSVYKDPTIENIGSEDAYVGAIISITGIGDLLTTAATNGMTTNVDEFILGGAIDNTANDVVTLVDPANGICTIYVIVKAPLTKADANGAVASGKVELFNQIVIPAVWDNAEMAECADLKITVDAYATQVAGFANAKTAITTVFGANTGDAFNGVFN